MATRVATARFQPAPTAEALQEALAARLGGMRPGFLCAFASPAAPLQRVMDAIADAYPSATSIGCTTAGEFSESDGGKQGVALFALAGDDVTVSAGIGEGLKANPEAALMAAIPSPRNDAERPYQTAILLLDPLSGNGEESVLLATALLGPQVRLAGGAAGDDLKFSQAEVACGREVKRDAAVVAILRSRQPPGIGVRHGHKPISRPLSISKAEGSVVHEIDGRPAFEVWKELVRPAAQRAGVTIDQEDRSQMGAHFLRFELGLVAGPNEYKMRAPLSVSADGSLSFVCGIPEGAVIRLTESVEEDQVSSARAAALQARKALGDRPVAGALVFDCICRSLILGQRFGGAVREMHAALGEAPLAGFETYGEIAMELGQSSGFHNTTTVVLAFPG
jgi:methyl-accepting chemotaxis protein